MDSKTPTGSDDPAPGADRAETSMGLLERARNGDAAAVERLCQRYLPVLRRWSSGRLPRWARGAVDTDDLVQDTLIQTLRNLEGFEPRHDGALQAYLRQAVHNRVRDEVRRARRRPAPAGEAADRAAPGPSPLEEAVGHEVLERYEAALARLRPEEREAIVLRVELGHSYLDLACAMAKPSADAARMMVSRALVRLAEEMRHEP